MSESTFSDVAAHFIEPIEQYMRQNSKLIKRKMATLTTYESSGQSVAVGRVHHCGCVYEVSLATKYWCLWDGAQHTDLTLLTRTPTQTPTTTPESDPYVTPAC